MTGKNTLYLRKWKISVVGKYGKTFILSDSENEPRALRCTFCIEKALNQVPQYADITVYNLNGDTEAELIEEGQTIIVEAGYREGTFGTIYKGQVFQKIRDRENVVDYTLTFHCIDCLNVIANEFVNFTMNDGGDQRSQIREIARQATTPIEVGYLTPYISDKKLPRGKTFFGEPKKFYRDISLDNNAQLCFTDGKAHIVNLAFDPAPGTALVITPETGLIGTPQQVQYGVTFTTLLDPRIQIFDKDHLMMVKLDMVLIRRQKIFQGQIQTMLDQDGIYRVIGVTYRGDTRGNEWYCEVMGVNRIGAIDAMLGTGINMEAITGN